MQQEKPFTRDEIAGLSVHSDLEKPRIVRLFRDHVLIGKREFINLLRYLLLAGGIILIATGLVFFFAYNWKYLSSTWKFTVVWIFQIGFLIPVWLPKSTKFTKQLLLTAASIFTGVLFAVYGQVYQTGAFTYQYISLWVALISIWVFTAHFTPLWLLYHYLILGGIYDYTQDPVYACYFLYAALGLALLWNHYKPQRSFPYWYLVVFMTAYVTWATYIMGFSIADTFIRPFSWGTFLLILAMNAGLFVYALYRRWIIPIAHLCVSGIIVLDVKIVESFSDNLFIPAFITLLALSGAVVLLVYLRNKWKHATH